MQFDAGGLYHSNYEMLQELLTVTFRTEQLKELTSRKLVLMFKSTSTASIGRYTLTEDEWGEH